MPIQISNKELKAIETKILRENSFKSALKNIVQKEFDKIQNEIKELKKEMAQKEVRTKS